MGVRRRATNRAIRRPRSNLDEGAPSGNRRWPAGGVRTRRVQRGTSWAPLAARLSDFRCILIDRPGCGLSPRVTERHSDLAAFGRFADDLVADVLDALAITDAHLVGTSLGGYFVIRAAAAHPDRVRRLVTLSWSFGAPTASTPMVMRVAMQPFLGRLALRIPPTERMARSMLKQIGLRGAIESGRFGPVETAWFLSLLRDTDTMRNEIEVTPRILTLRGFNEETRLPSDTLASVRCPALFLWGEDDPMGGAGIAEAFVAPFPDGHLELMTGAGHAPWMDDPDHVAARVDHLPSGSVRGRRRFGRGGAYVGRPCPPLVPSPAPECGRTTFATAIPRLPLTSPPSSRSSGSPRSGSRTSGATSSSRSNTSSRRRPEPSSPPGSSTCGCTPQLTPASGALRSARRSATACSSGSASATRC